ncbi:hypothetical protein MKX01_040132 [Papaver californicum]|nr:hypothetical protein MKX01_040132 [Papaver californicum]
MAANFRVKTTSSFFLFLCLTVILFFTLSCFAADPDPLQDICVADLNSTIKVNGFPCKPEYHMITIPFNLFNSTPTIPNYILAKNFRVDEKVIAIIKSQFSPNAAMAAEFSFKTTSSFFLVLCLTVILFFTLSCFSADPDPLQDFCVADLNSKIKLNGFPCKPDGLMNEPSTANPLGAGLILGDVTAFPGMNTQGLTVSRIDLAPGGIPLHTHPRASEANFIMEGEEVLFGFITTSDVLYSKVMKAKELSIIPRGLVHFAKNVGPGKAIVLAILNSQLPGFATLPNNFFASKPTIPNDILAKNFRVDENVIAMIKSNVKTTSSFFLVLCLTVILFFTLSFADLNSTTNMNGYPCKPESQVTSDDFFFSGLMTGASTDNPLGYGPKVTLASFLVDIRPGGTSPLHVHPRASESHFIIKGEVLVGFVTTTDVLYSKVLKAGEMSIIPRGLVHFVTNVGPKKAILLGIFNSQQPGIARIPDNLFAFTPKIPNYILAKNFRVDEKIIAIIKSKFALNGSLAIGAWEDI